MSLDQELLQESAEELFEDAPCGYLATDLDSTIVRVNRTFEAWTGHRRDELLGRRRFPDLLSPGGRIYYETHYAPLLHMQGEVREIAVEIVCADGSRLPALVNSTLRRDAGGRPRLIRTTIFDATDRRRYEQELLKARRHEREIAQALQGSLLAGELPVAEGLAIDVVYRPGVEGLEVGGDWYDAFWLDEGRVLALVVGDVVGRGIGAAATMGQLRSAVRALAAARPAPGAVLEALDAFSRRHRIGQMTTVVYAELDLQARRLRHAAAGHPPPLLLAPGAAPAFAWDGRSLPLDTGVQGATGRPEGIRDLPPGGAVLLYTDGVIERREQSLQAGLDRLAAEAAPLVSGGVELAAVVEGLRDAENPDDVCVLAARLPG